MVHSSMSGISPLGSSPASASNSEHELGGYSQGEADADDEDGLTYDDYQLYLAQAGGSGIRTATAGSVQDDVLIDEMIPGYVKIRMLDTAAPATPKKRRATKPKIDRSGVEMDEDAPEECDCPSPPSALRPSGTQDVLWPIVIVVLLALFADRRAQMQHAATAMAQTVSSKNGQV